MNVRTTYTGLLAVSLIAFWSCQTTQKTAFLHPFDSDYYSTLSSNQERLQALLTGVFVQHHYENQTQLEEPWLVNDEQDSIILLSRPVGDPNKHGYWIYQYQYMTHLPDEPFYKSLINIRQIDRDTFHLVYHRPAKVYTLEEVLSEDLDVDMEFEDLEVGKTRVYIRHPDSRTQYEGFSPISLRRAKDANNENIEVYLKEELNAQPDCIRMRVFRYESETATEPMGETRQQTWFKRLKEVPGRSTKRARRS